MNTNRTALLLIDLQRDFLADDGRLRVHRDQVQPMLEAIGDVVEVARARDVEIVHVVNSFPRWSIANLFRKLAAIEGSSGAQLDPRAPQPREGEARIAKKASSAFSEPALDRLLRERGVGRLVLVGVFAGGCVTATARGALGRGYEVQVVGDAVADRSRRARERALRRLERLGCAIEPRSSFADIGAEETG